MQPQLHFLFPALLTSLLVKMGQSAFQILICAIAIKIVMMPLINLPPSVCLRVQLICLLVLMDSDAFLMNLPPSAHLHVQLTCLPVKMD